MENIPKDVYLHIFSYLSYWDLRLAEVSKQWRKLYWHRRGNNLSYGNGAPTASYWREFFNEIEPKFAKRLSLRIDTIEDSIFQDGLLFKQLINLETLIVNQLPHKNEDASFSQLPLLTRLRTLKMDKHKDSMQNLAKCINLECLALPRNCKNLNTLTTLSNLQDLKFYYFGGAKEKLTDAQMLLDSMTQLKKLCVDISEVNHMFNIQRIPGLKELAFEIHDGTSNEILETGQFSASKEMQLDKLKLLNVAYKNMDGLQNAKELNNEFNNEVPLSGSIDFEEIGHMTNLQKLRLSSWMVVMFEEEPTMILPNLTSLTISDDIVSVFDISAIFNVTPNLKEVHIQTFENFVPYSFNEIDQFTQLESFKLYGFYFENIERLKTLKERNLKVLGLDATDWDQKFFEELGKFNSLANLSIQSIDTKKNPLDLTPIFSHPNLEILYLRFLSSVMTEDADKWFKAANDTKLSLVVIRNEYARLSAWQKIFQFDKWKWIRLGDLEAANSPIIKEISRYRI